MSSGRFSVRATRAASWRSVPHGICCHLSSPGRGLRTATYIRPASVDSPLGVVTPAEGFSATGAGAASEARRLAPKPAAPATAASAPYLQMHRSRVIGSTSREGPSHRITPLSVTILLAFHICTRKLDALAGLLAFRGIGTSAVWVIKGVEVLPDGTVDEDAERLKKTSNSITHISQDVSAAAEG
jgi:hypothetical protein